MVSPEWCGTPPEAAQHPKVSTDARLMVLLFEWYVRITLTDLRVSLPRAPG